MDNPNYYAILTSEVRYSNKISANEKLLFAEITALSNKTGECWASNSYFADLYNVTPQAISKWVNNLAKCGFIGLDYLYKSGTKEIEKRIIKCINHGLGVSTTVSEVSTMDCGGYQQRIKDNNTSINNKHNNINKVVFDYTGFGDKEIESINLWLQYKKERKQSLTKTGLTALRNKLLDLQKKGQVVLAINNSMSNNWAGLFEDKIVSQVANKSQTKLHRANSQDYGDEVF